MILYLNEPREWRPREFKSSEFVDMRLCLEADLVVECKDGRFRIIKDRDGYAQEVPMMPTKDRINV